MTIQEAYQYCLYCGSKAELKDANHLACPNCKKKYFFSPSIGVAGFCRNRKGEIVLIERNIEPHKGTLGLPAGFVDIIDVSLEAALEREIFEEIGAKIKNIKYLSSHLTIYPFAGVDRPHMSTFWICDLVEDSNLNIQTSEISTAFFIYPTEAKLDKFGFESTKSAVKEYLAIINK